MLSAREQPQPVEVPRHIAIIMDGNGRWAAARGLPRAAGHSRGADAVRATVEACRELGVAYLTLYAFSSENWNRPKDEVEDLMGLLRHYLNKEVKALKKNGVRVHVIGDRGKLPADIVALIEDAECQTEDNSALHFIIAISYGGRAEMVRAARALAEKVAAGQLTPEQVTEAALETELYTHGVPDPDLVIRTSGEQRLSNFLLWQTAYSELLFTDVYWPDFNREQLCAAINEFNTRERRFGVRPEKV